MNFDFQKDIVLENSRVRLQVLDEDSRPGLLNIAINNPALLRYSPKMIGTEVEFNDYFNESLLARTAETRYAFSIFDKSNNSYAGSTSLAFVSNKNRRLEIGWTWIGAKFQRSGLNRNCKFVLMEYVFDQLKFERLELKTDARNTQSRCAIEKIGGKFEGILRSHILMSDGHRRDTVYYSILKDEWPDLKSRFRK
ncbi:MAG: RimJ/RimL family protein N-acetyltransferase [Flavobacteriales bacterium]|jgi:RimJ/RimL family protein N-acetyltransferase